jgi:hypothetical protein
MSPSKKEIRNFLDTYDRMLQYKSMTSTITGIFALAPENMPSLESVKVYDWLNEVSVIREKKH